MTGHSELRSALAAGPLQRQLTTMVRRRVPASDVDDVVQAVVCDALAAARAPGDPADFPRWLMGIARHKVADFHRRFRREPVSEAVEAVAATAPVEARDVLARILSDANHRETDQQTLHWAVREHEGDRLADIATEEKLPAEVVRQRVSRFRRRLRERWLVLAAAALCVGLVSPWVWMHRASLRGVVPASTPARAHFRVVEIQLPQSVDGARAGVLRGEALLSEVTLEGEVVTITTPVRTLQGHARLSPDHTGDQSGVLTLEDGRVFEIELHRDGELLVVRGEGGSVMLAR